MKKIKYIDLNFLLQPYVVAKVYIYIYVYLFLNKKLINYYAYLLHNLRGAMCSFSFIYSLNQI
jgi:hypothetical protein